MTRFLKIFFGIIAGLFLLLLIIPFAFKSKIETKVKEVINEEVNATVAWDNFSLSLIRNFPNLSVGLKGLSVVNDAPFEGDTLVSVENFSLAVDFMSALSGEAVDIKSILVDQPVINLRVNADSIANWDIVPLSEEEEVEEQTQEASSFEIELQSFKIKNANMAYSDATMDFSTVVKGLDVGIKGDFTQDYTTIEIDGDVEALDVLFEKIKYINSASIDLTANIGADLENMVFNFEDNELNFSGLPLFMEGTLAMLEQGYDMDLRLAARETDFKTILALVPDEYMQDVQGLKTQGSMALEATAKGTYVDTDNLPAFNFLMQVMNGSISYPDLPKSIDDIQVNMTVDNSGGSMDNTVMEIKSFHFAIDNNPFDANLKVVTPVSNATFKGGMKGMINLSSLAQAIPMDSIDLKGIINADMMIDGDYNMIEKEKYEDIKANGLMTLKDFEFRSPDFPMGVLISKAGLEFSPRYLELKSFVSQVGESDFSFTGRLENYLAYALQDGILKGSLQHGSNYINANELMALAGDDEVVEEELGNEDVTEGQEAEPMGKVLVPSNIDFVMGTNINKLLYDKLSLDKIKGQLIIKDSRVVMKGISTNLLEGGMVINGEYNTQDTLKPFVDFDMEVTSININQAANSFTMVESMMPVAKNAKGKVSTSLKFNSFIGDDFSPILSSFNGAGLLSSKEVEISGAKVQTALVATLKDEKYGIAKARDFLVNFRIDSGNVYIDPFDVNVFGKDANISGSQSLDQTMDYLIKMPVSRSEINSISGFIGGSLPEGEDIMMGIKITGTVTEPKLSVSTEEIAGVVKEVVKDEVKKAAEKIGGDAIKEAEEVLDELITDEETKEKIEQAGKKLKDLFK